jgi:hypothetical protein
MTREKLAEVTGGEETPAWATALQRNCKLWLQDEACRSPGIAWNLSGEVPGHVTLRITQRKPIWLIPLSIIWGWRAAGR